MAGQETQFSLLCRAGNVLCALPIDSVVETMRPMPLDALPGAPHFVAGVSVVRGSPMPVVFVGRLFAREEKHPRRLVTVRSGERHVGLAFDDVVGVRALDPDMMRRLPPLLRDAGQEAIAELGTLDGDLLVTLEAARAVRPEIFELIESGAAAS